MNRTERLYALVEELRASAPRRRSARELAAVYEVSTRTIERDIGALQQAGVPVYADPGRRGGYTIDPATTLPPLNFTRAEALAIALALHRNTEGPFDHAGRNALRKIFAAMAPRDAEAVRRLASRVRVSPGAEPQSWSLVPVVLEQALLDRLVLGFTYRDRFGELTRREVEPMALVAFRQGWYLVAWCRLREGVRVFRLDRIDQVQATGMRAPDREPPGQRTSPPGAPPSVPLLLGV